MLIRLWCLMTSYHISQVLYRIIVAIVLLETREVNDHAPKHRRLFLVDSPALKFSHLLSALLQVTAALLPSLVAESIAAICTTVVTMSTVPSSGSKL